MLVGEVEEDIDQVEGGVLASSRFKLSEHHFKESSEEIGSRFVEGLKLGWRFELAFDFEIYIGVIAVVGLSTQNRAFIPLG